MSDLEILNPLSLDQQIESALQSMLTADLSRNALARSVGYWVRDHHVADSLPIEGLFLASDLRFFELNRRFIDLVSQQNGTRP